MSDESTSSSSSSPTPKKQALAKKLLLAFGGILLVGSITAASVLYVMYAKTKNELTTVKTNPQQLADIEAKALIAKVARLVRLPEGEQPTIATVTNLDQLKSQPFFANASIGDKVFIYPVAKRAYLYNPTTDKIIEIGPIADSSNSAVAGASTEEKVNATLPGSNVAPTTVPTNTPIPTISPPPGENSPSVTPPVIP